MAFQSYQVQAISLQRLAVLGLHLRLAMLTQSRRQRHLLVPELLISFTLLSLPFPSLIFHLFDLTKDILIINLVACQLYFQDGKNRRQLPKLPYISRRSIAAGLRHPLSGAIAAGLRHSLSGAIAAIHYCQAGCV